MKQFLIVLPVLFAVSPASADMQSYSSNMRRMDPTRMTCAELQSELGSGSAVVNWTSSSGMLRWSKYMAVDGSCKMQNIKARASVKTSDGSCRVYQCNQYGRSPYR